MNTETLNPNQETESSAIPAIIAERNEGEDKQIMFRNSPVADALPKKVKAKDNAKDTTSLTPFYATVEYTTTKGNEKTAHLETQARDQATADKQIRTMIFANGLRQAQNIDAIHWTDRAPSKKERKQAKKAQALKPANSNLRKSPSKAQEQITPRSTMIARSLSDKRQLSNNGRKNADRTVAQRISDVGESASRLGVVSWVVPIFSAMAGAAFGVTKGLLSRNK